ncbi:MAG: CrcB family protein [Solirubrobacterales bacterium]
MSERTVTRRADFTFPEVGAVFAGGIAGTLARAAIAEFVPVETGAWPWATLTANVVGCAILGFVIAHLADAESPGRRVALLGTGLCGALTTFSTFQLELYELVDAGEAPLALGYLIASLTTGLLAVRVARKASEAARSLA